MAEIQDLINKLAKVEHDVFMSPLLKLSPEDAKNVTSRVDIAIKWVESHIKVFKSAHKIYVDKIKEYTTKNEEEMDLAIGECDTFLREV